MRTDLRLALLLTRGSDRREWWRVTLTAMGAGLATGFGLAAVAVASLQGQYRVSFGNGVLDQPGERWGVVLTLLLLLVPVLGFLGQCARVGAVHRDRRLAGLRLAGATPGQVRRIAALEAGLSCLAGSALAAVFSALFLLSEWHRPPAAAWAGFALVTVAVPLLGALVSTLALRRVVASPLGWVRRVRPRSCRRTPVVRPEGGPRGVRCMLSACRAQALVLDVLGSVPGAAKGVPPCSSEAENLGARAWRRGADGSSTTGPSTGQGPGLAYLAAALVILIAVLLMTPGTFGGFHTAPLLVFVVVIVTGLGAVWLTGATARLTGRLLADRTGNPATLIAAERLRDDPWAAARTHAAVLLVTVVGTGFVGVRQVLLHELTGRDRRMYAYNLSFYTTGINLTGAAVLVALAIALSGLAVGTAESLATRRRGLSAQTAAGVPRAVLGRALLLETALPLAPAVALAGVGGLGISAWYAGLAPEGGSVPLLPLLVPVVVYAACLLAAATSLPLLRRSAHPAELRFV